MNTSPSLNDRFERFSGWLVQATGSSTAFLTAFGVILAWAVTGPLFQFSETWQLVINTGTTIITFLMVFVIQKAQNRDGKAVQVKLNELIMATRGASNKMMDAEELTEAELTALCQHYQQLASAVEHARDHHRKQRIANAGQQQQ
jgi:low affinity Fe/Cu permease